jgi:ABC-type nitrate/sulfonate/bicarbonate transport system substrate-binding protein
MKRKEFIEQAQAIVERVQESTQGIADWLEEATPEDAAKEIADLVPAYAFEDE